MIVFVFNVFWKSKSKQRTGWRVSEAQLLPCCLAKSTLQSPAVIHHTLTKFALILTPFSINWILNTAVASFVLVDIDCFLFIFYDWIWHQTWFDQKIFCCLQQNNLFELHSLIHYIWRKEKDPLPTRVFNKRLYLVVSHTNTHCWFPPAVLLSSPRLVVAWLLACRSTSKIGSSLADLPPATPLQLPTPPPRIELDTRPFIGR